MKKLIESATYRLVEHRWKLLGGIGVIVLFTLAANVQDWPDATGFNGKTLWDVLQLVVVPIALAWGVYWINKKERERELKIAQDNYQEATLQSYLDQMKELLLDRGLRTSERDEEVRLVARTVTLATLQRLDGKRKRTLIEFLYEAKLITKDRGPIISLQRADLSSAKLAKSNLPQVDLSGANLLLADLDKADLHEANLCSAIFMLTKLRDANMRGANLVKAQLNHTLLERADLSDANLNKASLSGSRATSANFDRANLGGAYFAGADLSYATMRQADLREACLGGIFVSSIFGGRGAKLYRTCLNDADLSGADLSGTSDVDNPRGFKLLWAKWRGYGQIGADLRGAILEGANLDKALVQRVRHNYHTLWPEKFRPFAGKLPKRFGK